MTTESTPTATFESKVNETMNEATSEGERMLARAWKMIAANGLAAIVFGFVLVLWPDIGLTTIVAVVAVYALVRGVLSGLAAFTAPLLGADRAWLLLEAAHRNRDRHRAARLERHLREGAPVRGGRLGDRHRRPHDGLGPPASSERRA